MSSSSEFVEAEVGGGIDVELDAALHRNTTVHAQDLLKVTARLTPDALRRQHAAKADRLADLGIQLARREQGLGQGDAGVDRVGAMIGEPIMGAGGVIIPPKTYWPVLAAGLKERDILLISDEVICGFGRLGEWFGFQHFGITPDLVPMAAGE